MISRFLETSALDWVIVLFRPQTYFPFSKTFSSSEVAQTKKRISEAETDSLDEIIKQLKERFNDEEKRREQIESKARSLQGFTALAGSFIVGFAQFLIGNANLEGMVRLLVIIAYICIALSLLMTVTLAQKAVNTARFVRPTLSEWWGFA